MRFCIQVCLDLDCATAASVKHLVTLRGQPFAKSSNKAENSLAAIARAQCKYHVKLGY